MKAAMHTGGGCCGICVVRFFLGIRVNLAGSMLWKASNTNMIGAR
jgi:hypothetical protein